MPWWVWVLLGWSLLAVGLGVVLGRALQTAERLEHGHDPPAGEQGLREPGGGWPGESGEPGAGEPGTQERPRAS